MNYACLGVPGCSHPAHEPCDCKCHKSDKADLENLNKYMQAPKVALSSELRMIIRANGIGEEIQSIADKAYALGTLNGLDKAGQEIYKVEALRHADEVHCSCLVVLRDNLSKINEEKERNGN